MKRFLKRKAFTIIEMVIVIAVIGILATVMIPTVSGMIEKANKSADTQFAASLTIQLAMESVDGGIDSEEDLRAVIDEYYGEDYYDTKLAPKAGKSGNHFWYDVVNGSVIAKTYEEIVAIPGPESAGPTKGEFEFETANPRTIVTENGNCYFLMDCGGSAVVNDVFKALDAMTSHPELGVIIGVLQDPDYTDSDNALCAKVLPDLLKTAIMTNSGIVAGGNTIEHIYVAKGSTKLGSGTYLYNGTDAVAPATRGAITFPENYTIELPAGVMFGEDSLKGLPENTELKVVVKTETELGQCFEPNGAYYGDSSCVIVLPAGDRFVQIENKFYPLNADGTVGEDAVDGATSDYAQTLADFSVGLENSDGVTDKKLYYKTEGNILYIADGFTGEVILSTSAFVDTESNPMTPGRVNWQYTNTGDTLQNAVGEKLTVAANTLKDGSKLMVKVQDKFHEMTVKLVKVEGAYVDAVGGKTPTDYDGTTPIYTQSYNAANGGSWVVKPGYYTTDGIGDGADEAGHIKLNAEPSFSSTDGKLSYSDGYLKAGQTVANTSYNLSGSCTFSYGSVAYTFKINVVDTSKAAFAVADAVQKQLDYGLTAYTIGTVNNINLGQLFKPTTGASLSGQNVICYIEYNGSPIQEFKYTTGWANTALDLSQVKEDVSVTIKIGVAGTVNDGNEVIAGDWCKLPVEIKYGARNVDDVSDWVSVDGSANKKGLVLLTDLKNFADGAGMISVTNATVYGNLHKISWDDGTYLVMKQADNAIITLNNGTVDNLIIDGPTYTSTSTWGNAASTGVYVFGVYANGTATVTNSYISGFMAPVGAKTASSTVNLTSTVLKGGAMGNIYVNQSGITLNITNCTMIRNYEGNLAAPGIYLDEKSTNTTITMSGTAQHTFATADQATTLPGVSSMGDTIAGWIVSAVNGSVGTHKIGTTTYVHMGVLMHASATVKGWTNNSTYTINGETYKYTEQSYLGMGAKACVVYGETSTTSKQHTGTGWTHSLGMCNCPGVTTWTDNCSHCDGSSGTHVLFPDYTNDGKYTAADFLATYND